VADGADEAALRTEVLGADLAFPNMFDAEFTNA
jgi:hypothetical protein